MARMKGLEPSLPFEKIAMQLGKVSSMPPGGCDFWKKPEQQNTRRVRLPDRYYEFFRDALHPALKCA